jgi:hypothetical protein
MAIYLAFELLQINKKIKADAQKNLDRQLEIEKDIKIAEETTKQKHLELEIARARRDINIDFRENHTLKNGVYDDEAYKTSKSEVEKAQERIIIVSDYSPKREMLEVTGKRQEYYKAIEEVIEKNIQADRSSPFHYVRFMQRDPENYKLIKNNERGQGKIDKYDFINGDEQGFCHCKRILKLKDKYKDNFNLELWVTPNIPSMPSILIVDTKKMLFTIPERIEGRSAMETAGVLIFTDNTDGKSIIQPFISIINSLPKDNDNGEKEVVKIISIEDFEEAEWRKWK